MTINEKQDEIIDEFELFEDQLDKTQYIIDLGKKLPPMPESKKTDENRIMGCQSKVWVDAELKDDRLYFYGDSEPTAQISKGLVGLLIRVLSGEKPDDIANADLYFIPRVGMGNLITSLRAGGLASMIERMKAYGRAYSGQTA
ncbi:MULTISPECIES: SufE family protein [unclassified Spirosoma]|uniref:SufE family protein n=1 Tax=unclassified Spirosoma TaxID=2621999 RepID=UPI0009681E2A|nr:MULTISPECIES: SufE family protein [unclassified Spirosoma]MBN8826985.1 SufE family protein [Spirosoma sp.]OJW75129.1 MAG: Fe-S metabolism protein SufE [Spirosoma sp. 48-14]